MNRRIAIISDLIKSSKPDFSRNTVTIDLYDEKTKSIKHVNLYFISDVYQIGDLVSYNEVSNCINRYYYENPEHQVSFLKYMRKKYFESLMKIYDNEIEFMKNNKNDTRAVLSYLSTSEIKREKLILLMGKLDSAIEFIDKFLDDYYITKKRK